jgi:protein gp37
MGFESKIEWTHHTFNIVWGCTNVSEGCRHCYAHTLSNRYGYDVWGKNKGRRRLSDKYWQQPFEWNRLAKAEGRRKRVFCSSMADVFEDHADNNQERPRLWSIIRQTRMLDWLLLTKRPENVSAMLPENWGDYDNVWLGTSVEDERVLHRIHTLVGVPAIVHFLSLEPLIGPLPNLPLADVEWAIVGGESGPGARNMEENWVLEIQDQCDAAGVPFFFKQWGGVNKSLKGRALRERFYDATPDSASLIAQRSAECVLI